MGYTRLTEEQWEKAPWEFKVAVGYSGRFSTILRFGYNDQITQAAFEDVWNVGGNLQYLANAEFMDVVSTSAADTELGTGAQTVGLTGVDFEYKRLFETIPLNGLTPVQTKNKFLRVETMRIDDVGSGEINAGEIDATADLSGTIQCRIEIDLGASSGTFITIPDGFFALITAVRASTEGTDPAIIDFQTRLEGKGFIVGYRTSLTAGGTTELDFMRFQAPVLAPPHTDIKVRGIYDAGGSNRVISAGISLYLIDEREINT